MYLIFSQTNNKKESIHIFKTKQFTKKIYFRCCVNRSKKPQHSVYKPGPSKHLICSFEWVNLSAALCNSATFVVQLLEETQPPRAHTHTHNPTESQHSLLCCIARGVCLNILNVQFQVDVNAICFFYLLAQYTQHANVSQTHNIWLWLGAHTKATVLLRTHYANVFVCLRLSRRFLHGAPP